VNKDDFQFVQDWRERIARLRVVSDMTPPWEFDSDIERWKRGLGVGPERDDSLNAHMLEWQVWLRSLTSQQRLAYESRHPEPHGWGLYHLTFSRPAIGGGLSADAYWDFLERHYTTFLE
jgi:hypothetical protein